MNRVLVTGGAGTIGAAVVRRLLRDPDYEVRVSDQRPAPDWMREGCEVHTRRPARPRAGARGHGGCTHVIHLAAIVGGIAQLPQAPPHADRGQQRALQRGVPRRARPRRASASSTCRARWCSSAPTEFPTTEEHIRDTPIPQSAYGFSKLPARCTCRAADDEHGLPYTICRPFNAYGPGEMPEDEPGIAHAVPDLIRKVLSGQKPLQIFGDGTQTRTLTHIDDIADGDRDRDGSPAGPARGLQHLGRRGAARSRRSRGSSGRSAARTPARSSSSTCRASRSTSCAAGRAWRRPSASWAGRRRSTSAQGSARRWTGCASTSRRPRSRSQRGATAPWRALRTATGAASSCAGHRAVAQEARLHAQPLAGERLVLDRRLRAVGAVGLELGRLAGDDLLAERVGHADLALAGLRRPGRVLAVVLVVRVILLAGRTMLAWAS